MPVPYTPKQHLADRLNTLQKKTGEFKKLCSKYGLDLDESELTKAFDNIKRQLRTAELKRPKN